MTIVPAQISDFTDIEKIFADCFSSEAFMYPIKRATHLFVAKEGQKIVGAGGLFISSLHAKIPKAAIAVESNYRRKGLGRKIHQTILQSNPEIPLGIDGSCYQTDSLALSFISEIGYEPYLNCLIPVVDLSAEFPVFEKPKNLKLLSFNEAALSGVKETAILHYLVNKYCATHSWSPVTIPQDSPDWEEIAFWGIDRDLSLVGLIDGMIVAASTASVDGETLQLQWPFATADGVVGETALLMSLLERQFKTAKERGLLKTTFECDSTEEAMFNIPEKFKILDSKTWRRFRFRTS